MHGVYNSWGEADLGQYHTVLLYGSAKVPHIPCSCGGTSDFCEHSALKSAGSCLTVSFCTDTGNIERGTQLTPLHAASNTSICNGRRWISLEEILDAKTELQLGKSDIIAAIQLPVPQPADSFWSHKVRVNTLLASFCVLYS